MFHRIRPKLPPLVQPESYKFDLLEIHFQPNIWKVMVSCLLLNRTNRRQVDPIIDRLFKAYPNQIRMANADQDDIEELISSLGFQKRRAKMLIQMARHFVDRNEDWISPEFMEDCPGVGEYGMQAYRIIFLGDRSFMPKDHALRNLIMFEKKNFEVCPYCFHPMETQHHCDNCSWIVPAWYNQQKLL